MNALLLVGLSFLGVVEGREATLFFAPEIAARARLPRVEGKDSPVEAIADFHAQLARAGVKLLVAPVPLKAAVWADRLPPPRPAPGRLAAFLAALEKRGVATLDLEPVLAGAKLPAYCRQDTHWSGHGVELAAAAIARRARELAGAGLAGEESLASERREVEIAGDLWRERKEPRPAKEKVALRFVGRRTPQGLEPLAPARDSPLLLLGDSHVLVFHQGGDLHAVGAGLPDQLALELGRPIDVLGVRGSGANPARLSLARRADNLAGKKLVVWVFSARELDPETGSAWKTVPVVR